jgi:hypothetical protein
MDNLYDRVTSATVYVVPEYIRQVSSERAEVAGYLKVFTTAYEQTQSVFDRLIFIGWDYVDGQ